MYKWFHAKEYKRKAKYNLIYWVILIIIIIERLYIYSDIIFSSDALLQ